MNPVHFHPMLVHFPIALALTALLFDLCSYRFRLDWLHKTTAWLTLLAALGAAASVLSGFLFTKPVAGLAAIIKEEHVTWAVITTVLLVITAAVALYTLWKNRWQGNVRYLITLLLILCAVGISLTGMKGGSIVYDVWLF